MKARTIRLLSYFQIISQEGEYLSSWYLAQKTGQTKNRVAKDIRYARRKKYIVYKIAAISNLLMNFRITEKGKTKLYYWNQAVNNIEQGGKVA